MPPPTPQDERDLLRAIDRLSDGQDRFLDALGGLTDRFDDLAATLKLLHESVRGLLFRDEHNSKIIEKLDIIITRDTDEKPSLLTRVRQLEKRELEQKASADRAKALMFTVIGAVATQAILQVVNMITHR